jgi:hypothetical protein
MNERLSSVSRALRQVYAGGMRPSKSSASVMTGHPKLLQPSRRATLARPGEVIVPVAYVVGDVGELSGACCCSGWGVPACSTAQFSA